MQAALALMFLFLCQAVFSQVGGLNPSAPRIEVFTDEFRASETPPRLSEYKTIIPHLAQGQGWSTIVKAINTCNKPIVNNVINPNVGPEIWRVLLYGSDGRLKRFKVGRLDKRELSLFVDRNIPENGYSWFELPDLGPDELRQGYGVVAEDGDGCLSVEVEYRQEAYSRFATIPVSREKRTPGTLGLTFNSRSGWEHGVAIVADGGPVELAVNSAGGDVRDRAHFESVYHMAFPLYRYVPEVDGRGYIYQLQIKGAIAATLMEFWRGKLAQFRVPHYYPLTVDPEF